MTAVLPLDSLPAATPARAAPARAPARGFAFGKYREIIIAVGFFLLFDLGVLVLNFYTSFKIDQDTVAINLAGRQRYVSQRIARTLLELDAARTTGQPYKADTLAELRSGTKIFQISQAAFRDGGTIPGGDGKPVFLEAVATPHGRELEAKVEALWKPYYDKLQPIVGAAPFEPEQLAAALAYSQANNSALLNSANDFVTETQFIGASRASVLRMVQTGGIVLALLNFAFILFKFLNRLRTSDAEIEAATEENRQILTSVREGLFLLTPDFHLGSQLSQSSHLLFDRKLAPGDDFFALLQPLVSAKALADARDYVALLFSPHVKEALVQGINPLAEVEASVRNRLGQEVKRYLSFHFNRVHDGGAVRHLLVTVQDISQRIDLEHRLHGERQRSQKEFAMLLAAIEADPALLRQFVAHAESNLLQVNDLLRGTGSANESALLKRLDQACRLVHAVKGDASTLGLDTLANQAHLFETELQRIRESGGGDQGNALLALPMPLEDLLAKVTALKSLTRADRPAGDTGGSPDAVNEALGKLANGVAADSGKKVQAVVRMGSQGDLQPPARDLVREMAVQLVRNAVAHGIESPATRTASGKAPEGKVDVALTRADDEWTLSVKDDGAGLSAARIRQRLIDLGWYTPLQLESLSERQIVGQIFKPGFSTAGSVGMHAGRGVGLDLVHANVQRLGGRMTLTSTPGKFTEFRIRFDA
jgi:two-component system chemotaxis sensor kinase CheA